MMCLQAPTQQECTQPHPPREFRVDANTLQWRHVIEHGQRCVGKGLPQGGAPCVQLHVCCVVEVCGACARACVGGGGVSAHVQSGRGLRRVAAWGYGEGSGELANMQGCNGLRLLLLLSLPAAWPGKSAGCQLLLLLLASGKPRQSSDQRQPAGGELQPPATLPLTLKLVAANSRGAVLRAVYVRHHRQAAAAAAAA